MIYICIVCTGKKPSLLILSDEHRQILEVIVSPTLNLAKLNGFQLWVCESCKCLISTVETFRNIAIVGTSHLLTTLDLVQKEQDEQLQPADPPLLPVNQDLDDLLQVKSFVDFEIEEEKLKPQELEVDVKIERYESDNHSEPSTLTNSTEYLGQSSLPSVLGTAAMATADEASKKKYYKWSKDDMAKALSAYDKKEMGINKICKQYQVPKATLLRHVKLLNKFANQDNTHKGRPTVFSIEQEQQLVDHLLLLESHMFGLTVDDVRRLAYQIAEYNQIPHTFNKEKGAASNRWFYAFKKRHPEISIRQRENTSLNRVRGFDRENVSGFYDLLEKIVDDNSIQASNIFNADETGISTVRKKAQKVVGLKSKKLIGSVTSGERGINTTAVCCASATGQLLPVMLIFKGKRNCLELADGAPADSVVTISDTGHINSALFVKWIKHFIAIVKPTQDKKVLLLLNGHTHTRNLEALILARENGIIMVQLPEHTTHRLQPLDVSFFKPLNTYYVQAVEKWLRTNPGRLVTQYQIARLFGEAYERAATISNVTNGFRTAGIWPVDRNVFPSHLFEAADVLNENQSESRMN